MDGVSWVWFQLRPQMQNSRIDNALAYVSSIPNIIQNTFAGQYLTVRSDEVAEEFRRTKGNVAAAYADFRPGEIDFDRSELVNVDSASPGPPE
jgi:hypothetical protein